MEITLQNKLRDLRNKLGLSQERFGKKIGVSGKTISSYEHGRSTPPLKVLEIIGEVYGVPIVKLNKSKEQEIVDILSNLDNCLKNLRGILDNGLSL